MNCNSSHQKSFKINLKNYENAIDFINLTNRSSYEFDLKQNQMYLDGKSMLGVLSLDLSKDILVYTDRKFDETLMKKWIK